jgi:N-acetylmuramic acid 6-phosphate etherase
MEITVKAQKRAKHFLENEKQFQLGMMPTEQSNQKTKDLDKVFESSTESGIEMLFSVDEEIVPMAEKIFTGKEFAIMLEDSYKAITNGGKIIFSGCGATGRLSILLESMWRTFFRKLEHDNSELFKKVAQFEDTVFSIMTGGDYALIKSVESFEDYPQFGQRQAQELNINSKDSLIAITEGGETSSVIGSVKEAVAVGAKAFLMFNNPTDILCEHIERSREVIEDPAVTVLDLHCGPMAVAGSTRMQATSSEQLIAGALLEKLLSRILHENLSSEEFALFPDSDIDYAAEMEKIVCDLKSRDSLKAIAEYIHFEKQLYNEGGLVTYFVDEFLIDVFTDTTERAPTFMLAPFKKFDDVKLLPSWAFVKTPLFSTPNAWKHYLGRELRCLEWMTDDYVQMRIPEEIINNQPAVSKQEMLKFLIGNEAEKCRFESVQSAAVSIFSGNEFNEEILATTSLLTENFTQRKILIISTASNAPENALIIPGTVKLTMLKLMDHMKVKLTLNTISTGTMVHLGRIKSNWMSFVSMSNKKLIDRCIRLISELGKISYEDACLALHQSIEELEQMDFTGKEEPSPVQYTLEALAKNSTESSDI